MLPPPLTHPSTVYRPHVDQQWKPLSTGGSVGRGRNSSPSRSAQNVGTDPVCELYQIGAPLHDAHLFEFVRVKRNLLFERRANWMIMVRVAREHCGEIFHR